MPVTKERLRQLTALPSTYQKGAAYYFQERAVVREREAEGATVSVRGTSHRYVVKFHYTPDGNDLKDYSCGCPAFEQYGGICKHIVAAVLAVQTTPELNAVLQSARAPAAKSPPTTDAELFRLIQNYAQKAAAKVTDANNPVKLETVLEIDSNNYSLSFRLGESRMYVLQDLAKFLERMEQGQTTSYGKSFSMTHCEEAFEPESLPLLHFLLSCYSPYNVAYTGGYYRSYGQEVKRRMFLSPHMLDELMEIQLANGGALNVSWGGVTGLSQIRDGEPELTLLLSKETGGYRLSIPQEYALLRGARTIYLIQKDFVFRCSSSYGSACAELLGALEKKRKGLFLVEDAMKTFFASVLMEVRPYLRVDAKEDLTAFEPLPLETKIYFDMPSMDFVTARMEFCYGDQTHPAFHDKKLPETQDITGEFRMEALLERYVPAYDKAMDYLYINRDEDAVYRLMREGVPALSKLARLFGTDAFNGITVRTSVSASVGVRMEADLLRMDFSVEGIDPQDLADVLSSYRRKKKYHRLRDGSFLDLENNALSELSELSEGLDLDKKALAAGHAELSRSRAMFLDTVMKQGESIRYDRDNEFRKLIRAMKDVADADYETPTCLRPVLRNYQKTGYRWLKTIDSCGFGGILADDMGLGKTLQVLALLESERAESGGLSLVVCPSSLVLNWLSEARRFTPSLRALAVMGMAAERAALLEHAGEYDLIVTSYDLLKRDAELYESLKFRYEIIDEAQYIKNQGTLNAKAVKAIHARTRFALTGTPVENSLAELWSIYDYLMPGYLYKYGRFKKCLEEPIVKNGDVVAAGRLRGLVAPFLLRRLKKEVLRELPEKTETILRAGLDGEQKALYLATLVQMKEELSAELSGAVAGQGKIAVLAALTRLRQLCCDPALLYENYGGPSAKRELCLELVQSCVESGHRLLLFSQFTSMLELLAQSLTALNIGYVRLEGSTKPSDRLALVEDFNRGSTPVFLISLKAGGTGLNLTGADVVIHYDPWWNVSAQNQATDRVYRIGQKNSVQVYKLIMEDTVEERILDLQEKKRVLADDIVQEGEGLLAGLDAAALLSLLEPNPNISGEEF